MKILIFSGAGLSAESGISTFRDANGLWEQHRIEDVCTFSTWKKNYELVHEFYNQRRGQLATVEPNEAHKIIAQLSKEYDVLNITQNVDNLLERAGCENVIHVHGELDKVWCQSCYDIQNIGSSEIDVRSYECPKCKHTIVKPYVVFFGESAPKYNDMYNAFDAIEDDDVIIIIGTEGSVVSIDQLLGKKYPYYRKGAKATKILINLNRSPYINLDNFDYVFEETATTGMRKAYEIIKSKVNLT